MKATELAKAIHALDAYEISPVFETNMPVYALDPGFWTVPKAKNVEQQYYNTNMIVYSEHNGSHVDAPAYKLPDGKTMDAFPADCLIGPYKKYDLRAFSPKAGVNTTLAQIAEVEARDNISVAAGDIVLLQFGWDRHYLPDTPVLFQKDYYAANAPGMSEEVMSYFADKKIRAIGADTVTPDIAYTDSNWDVMPGREKHFLPKGILTMGGFVGMAAAPNTGLFMTAALKVNRGSGSPIRALLFDDRGRPELLKALK